MILVFERFSIPSPTGKWGNEEEETTHTHPPLSRPGHPTPVSQGLCRLWPPEAGCESDGLAECCVTCGHITYAPLPCRRPQAWLHTEWTWTRIAWGCPQITPLHIGDSTSGNLAWRHLGKKKARVAPLQCLLWWQPWSTGSILWVLWVQKGDLWAPWLHEGLSWILRGSPVLQNVRHVRF